MTYGREDLHMSSECERPHLFNQLSRGSAVHDCMYLIGWSILQLNLQLTTGYSESTDMWPCPVVETSSKWSSSSSVRWAKDLRQSVTVSSSMSGCVPSTPAYCPTDLYTSQANRPSLLSAIGLGHVSQNPGTVKRLNRTRNTKSNLSCQTFAWSPLRVRIASCAD